MGEVIGTILQKMISGNSIPQLILTIIAMALTLWVKKLVKQKELESAKKETSKGRGSDQAGIDIPSHDMNTDYKKSQDEVRDILGKK